MNVTFEPAARDELDDIYAWIAKDSLRAAFAMIARIEPQLAHMGRPGLVEGTRELLEWPYIIAYKIHDDRDEVVIVSVVHGARDREDRDS